MKLCFAGACVLLAANLWAMPDQAPLLIAGLIGCLVLFATLRYGNAGDDPARARALALRDLRGPAEERANAVPLYSFAPLIAVGVTVSVLLMLVWAMMHGPGGSRQRAQPPAGSLQIQRR